MNCIVCNQRITGKHRSIVFWTWCQRCIRLVCGK
jgi:hypothetical protein